MTVYDPDGSVTCLTIVKETTKSSQNQWHRMGWDRLSGTGVATALKIIYWPTPFLTRPEASRLGGLFQ